MTDQLTDTVVKAAARVPGDLLVAGADAVEHAHNWSQKTGSALVNASTAARYRAHAEEISEVWSQTPLVSGAAIAAALRAAAATASRIRSEHDVSLVWTGPTSTTSGLRSTRSVLTTLVNNATSSLVLVSYATYNVAQLAEDLADAIERGVQVTLILEDPNNPGGPLDLSASHPFESIKDTASFYRWPKENRQPDFSPEARLHAKCVIADRSRVLTTSANLTSAGISDNVELGVLIEAGPLPAKLSDHLDQLIEKGTLERAET